MVRTFLTIRQTSPGKGNQLERVPDNFSKFVYSFDQFQPFPGKLLLKKEVCL
jgi:hypothetical protein